MGAVLVGGVPGVVVDAGELAFRPGKGVADPTGKLPHLLFQEEFGAIGAALAKDQLRFDVEVGDQLSTVLIIYLVLHVPVIDLGRELVVVVIEITVIAQRYLVGDLGFDVVAAGDPDIGGIR